MTIAQEAERFRNMSDAQYADLQNGRTTVEAIVTAPDYAEKIAKRREPNRDALSAVITRAELLAYGAACAREGYNLGHGAR